MLSNAYDELKKIVANAKQLVAFTGAGLSAESGIPTYRGAGGLWTKYDPSKYADINYFMKDPVYYWCFFRDVRYPLLKQAQPNPAHHALVALEKQGKLTTLITQNIDGLHQLAGQSHVIELHGNTKRFRCMTCDKRFSMDEIVHRFKDEFPPRCSCKGSLRPDTIFFGEALSSQALHKAIESTQHCDVFLVIGSSLVVTPAAQLPVLAKDQGAKLVIINIDKTPIDDLAQLVIHESASTVLFNVVD